MEDLCPWADLKFRSPFFFGFVDVLEEIYVQPRLLDSSPPPKTLLHSPEPDITYGLTWKLSLAAGDVTGLEFNIISYLS